MKTFDRKFGKEILNDLPTCPGIYRFLDAQGKVIYVGKAKNLRRRILQYRNARRIKRHRKMKEIVKSAARLEFQVCPSELDALMLETRLIQELRPRWNVSGAFYFLYPMIGLKSSGDGLSLLFSCTPQQDAGIEWHGAFRSREVTGDAFFSLVRLIGHVFRPQKSSKPKRNQGTYCFTFERIPEEFRQSITEFLKGNSKRLLEELILKMVDSPGARRRPQKTQEDLQELARFWRWEARKLKQALQKTKYPHYPVPQRERDLVFLRHRYCAPALINSFDPAAL